VSIFTLGEAVTERSPIAMVGTFAFVTTSDGQAYVINIDDDNYPDFEEPAGDEGSEAVYLALAMPHQLRDFVAQRTGGSGCNVDSSPTVLGPRLGRPDDRNAPVLGRFFDSSRAVLERLAWLPQLRTLHGVEYARSDTGELVVVDDCQAVGELSHIAPVDVRERAFPDLETVLNEEWSFTWEGAVSRDGRLTNVDGPSTRVGVLVHDGDEVRLVDGAAPFCEMGIEPYDIVKLRGCEQNVHCSLGEVCAFHPDTPEAVAEGLCIPEQNVGMLDERCRGVLLSGKQYTAVETYAGHLALAERRRVLSTTPVDGCVDDSQCADLAIVEMQLASAQQPFADPDFEELTPEEQHRASLFRCEPDPSRAPGINRCVMTCDESTEQEPPGDDGAPAVRDCEDGFVCSDDHCVHGVLPPPQCVQTLQRYEVRVGEAFAVLGRSAATRVTGFLHDRVADPDTGECVEDPDASPLLVGRLPLTAPPCEGDDIDDLSPNPCLTEVEHYEPDPGFEFVCSGEVCECRPPELQDEDDRPPPFRTVMVPALRFQNPVFTVHVVRPSTRGDLECFGDEAGELPPIAPVHQGFTLGMVLTGGFLPMFASNFETALPANIVEGPNGLLYVLDQGDVTSGTVTRGRVLMLDPRAAAGGFTLDRYIL
jgi:hypothetical protein